MEPFFRPVLTPPRPAATVVLLRDGARGPEVLMLRRHGSSDVLGGAYVFPGGKLDDDDSGDALIGRAGAPAEALRARLGEPELEARVAAGSRGGLPRSFEEASVLLARARRRPGRRAARRAKLRSTRCSPNSAWSSPRCAVPSSLDHRRCRDDEQTPTHFFVAALPGGQQARHDDHEATDSVWLTPREAIERYRRREIVLAPAQIMSLAQVGRHDSAAAVLDEARRRPPPVIEPESFEADGVRTLVYPGDERHSVRARAMPGPTRLVVRESRFEPPGGFDALFD